MFDAKQAREIVEKKRYIYIDDITNIILTKIKDTAEKGRDFMYIDHKFQEKGYDYKDFLLVEEKVSETLEELGFEIQEKRQDILTYYHVVSWRSSQ